jgi:uncharacterized membrane protein
VHATATITVKATPEEVAAVWRDVELFPAFMTHVKEVSVNRDGTSHWVATAPAGAEVEWDAEVTADVPAERMSWRSTEGASVPNTGEVRWVRAPGARGTEVHVDLSYDPPAGAAGAAVAELFGEEPNQQLRDDLRRFKQLLETGEIARSDSTPSGARARTSMAHAAQPGQHEQEVSR